jgi:hypothetical protein
MAEFDFILDEAFRESLESDYREIAGSFEAGHMKSVHILAGSIVEAVLVDHLVAASIVSREVGLKMELAPAITMCKEKGIISQRTAELSSVIRGYRNLIHPGRLIRLGERVDRNTAQIAYSLVDIVVDEVAIERRKNYGYTAEQIVSKLTRDSSADAIITHLLKEAPPREIERLLLQVLPKANQERQNDQFSPEHLGAALTVCFRSALKLADAGLTKQVANRFATILRTEDSDVVESYGATFFRGGDLADVAPEYAAMVKQHLLSRLKRDPSLRTFEMLTDIGPHLEPADAVEFVDPIVRIVTAARRNPLVPRATRFFETEVMRTLSAVDTALERRLGDWKKLFQDRLDTAAIERLEPLIGKIGFPF